MKLGGAVAIVAGTVIALAMQAGLGAQETFGDAFTLGGESTYLGLPLHFGASPDATNTSTSGAEPILLACRA